MAGAPKLKLRQASFFFGAAGLALAACADPVGSYEDFRLKTNDVRGKRPDPGNLGQGGGSSGCQTGAPGALPTFTTLPDMSGSYFVTCLANLSSCDVTKTLRFKGEAKKTSGDSYSFTFTPLLTGADSIDKVGGAPFDTTGTVAADGSFTFPIINALVPAGANAISGRELIITKGSFSGHVLTGDKLCSELDGSVTVEGQSLPLDDKGDICLLERAAPGQKFDKMLGDYHCP